MAKGKGMAMPSTDYEKNWEMERDVRALARSKAIMGDPERHKAAKAHAKKMLHEAKRRKEQAQNEAGEHQAIIDMAESK